MPETKTMFSRLRPSSGRKHCTAARIDVVAAAGAPAHLLVGGEVALGLLAGVVGEVRDRSARPLTGIPRSVVRHESSSRVVEMTSASSTVENGRPRT